MRERILCLPRSCILCLPTQKNVFIRVQNKPVEAFVQQTSLVCENDYSASKLAVSEKLTKDQRLSTSFLSKKHKSS